VLSFDCYGTIIDWETGLLMALKPVLATHSVKISDGELLNLYGRYETEIEAGQYRPYREVLSAVLMKFGEHFGFAPAQRELEGFSSSIRDWPPFDDSAAALAALQRRYRLAVLSNVDDDLFELSRTRLGISFDYVCTAQQIGSYKPSLRNFEYLLSRLPVRKSRLLHVAQSLYHDIRPAQRLEIPHVWINRRAGKEGSGATPEADVRPECEFADLRSLTTALEV
jgi:2-haloacid dehalogenase